MSSETDSKLDFGPLSRVAEDCEHAADEIGLTFRDVGHFR